MAALVAGCSTSRPDPRLFLRYEKGWEQPEVAAVVKRSESKDVEVARIGNTAWVSHHVAVVRTEEKPHYHRFHDLTVSVLRGEGILQVEQRRIPMREGDVAHIHRGTPHFFRNTGKGPAVAFAVFSPPYDDRDVVTAKIEPEKPPKKKRKKSWWWPF